MNRRKLLTLVAVTGACTAGLGTVVMPATAEMRTLTVTLLGGAQVTVTVDVPPGTPVDQIQIPGISSPIVDVQDSGPAATPTAQPTPAPTAQPQSPAPSPTPGSGQPAPKPGGGAEQGSSAPSRGDSSGSGKTGKGKGKGRNQANAQGELDGFVEDPTDVEGGSRDKKRAKKVDRNNRGRNTDGTPTLDNPTFSLATPGAAPIGVPNFFIQKFRIPPFLLPIYQAAGTQYGVRWELLAAINEIETDYGRNLNVSSAGALGWMQFMPATWKAYGVDANKDGVKDPYNPVDAIFAAARYLRAAGAEKDVPKAVFAYNHADWYVDSVLMRARLIGGLPSNLVGSLTGLTQGRFPVYAKATYADDLSERELTKRRKKGQNAAYLVESQEARRGLNIYARRGAPVIAANDGKIIRIGRTKRLGRFIQLQDVYGNTFTYARLGKIAERYPAPKIQKVTRSQVAKELKLPKADPKPSSAASSNKVPAKKRIAARKASVQSADAAAPARTAPRTPASDVAETAKERLFANPNRPNAQDAGGAQQVFEAGGKVPGITTVKGLSRLFGLDRKDVQLKNLKVGSKVAAGTILGRIGQGKNPEMAPHVLFEVRPAGRGAPRIDPKPILDGWKLLESTAIYRAAGKNPFFGRDAANPSIGQILLMSKEALAQRVINNPRIEIYDCGRRDIETSQIDRRVLASLEFLAASGLKPTVTSLKCGHGYLTKSGNVSHHSSGNAVDIAKVNGIPMIGNQGKGSITELAVQRLLTLQGTMKPDQIISLMKFEGADNTYAMADHDDHIHVGWQPMYGTNAKLAKQVNAALKPRQWIKLIDRLGSIDNPTVRTKPSKYSLKVKRASRAHSGE